MYILAACSVERYNVDGRINEVTHRWARLVQGPVTVRGYTYRLRTQLSHAGQLSLAISPLVGAMNTSESYRVNRHTARCTTPLQNVLSDSQIVTCNKNGHSGLRFAKLRHQFHGLAA